RRRRADPRQLLGRVRGRDHRQQRVRARRHAGALDAARGLPPDRAARRAPPGRAHRCDRFGGRGGRGLPAAGPAGRHPARRGPRPRVRRHGRLGLHLPPRQRPRVLRARRRPGVGLAGRTRAGRHAAQAPGCLSPDFPHLPGGGPRSSLPAPHHALHPDPIVNHRHALLVLAIGASLALSACKREPTPATDDTAATTPAGTVATDETADAFVARVNAELKAMYPEMTAAQWLSSTYINDDSQLLAAKSSEKFLTALNAWIEQSKKFEGQQMSPETARAITLLKLGTAMPAPRDPVRLAEPTRI